MITSTSVPVWDAAALAKQLQTIASQSQTLMRSFLSQQQNWGQIGLGDTSAIGGSFVELMSQMAADPASVARAQVELFNNSMAVWQRTAERMMGGRGPEASPGKSDKRFKHADWTENAMFSFIKESYLVAAKSILSSVRGVRGLDPDAAKKADFYTRQFVDAISPSNFMATNPEVIGKTLETGGQNLLHGLENLLADLERGDGRLAISMTDNQAFELGRNVATTPGKVVFSRTL